MPTKEKPVRLALVGFILGYALVAGYFSAFRSKLPPLLELIPFLWLPAVYYWYYVDANQRGYRRTKGMGAAIVLFCIVALPVYLARSRPSGERLKSIGKFLSLVPGYFLFAILGGLIGSMLQRA